MPDDMWPNVPAQRGIILADFDPEGKYGDRRQEIVFIGAGMDEEAISAQLDGALLTDEGEIVSPWSGKTERRSVCELHLSTVMNMYLIE